MDGRREDVVDGLLVDSSEAERRDARRLTTFLRLLSLEARHPAVGQASADDEVPHGILRRAERELVALDRRALLEALEDLLRHHLDALVVTGERADPDELSWRAPARDLQSAWSELEAARAHSPQVPDVPRPGESPLQVCTRLLEAAERLGARSSRCAVWRQRLARVELPATACELARFPPEDPRARAGREILATLPLKLARRRALLFDVEGPTLVLAAEIGEALAGAQLVVVPALRRAARGRVPVHFPSELPVRGARSALALPLLVEGRVHGLVLLASSVQGDLSPKTALRLEPALARAAVRWRAAQFRGWHLGAHGEDPWCDPDTLAWRERIPELVRLARSGRPVAVLGASDSGADVLARWFAFERAGEEPGGGAPVAVEIPPLARRRDELPGLARHLLGIIAQRAGLRVPVLTDDAQALIWRQPWPGGVPELVGLLRRALALAPADLGSRELRAAARARGRPLLERLSSRRPQPGDLAAALYVARLGNGRWNRTRAATLLGWDRGTLESRLRQAGFEPGPKSEPGPK